MKKVTRLLVGILFLSMVSSVTVIAQPIIDGAFDGTEIWGEPVAIADGLPGWVNVQSNVDSLFITQDDTYYYFAARILKVLNWQSWGFTINTKPGGGSEEVWGYSIVYGYDDLPDYVIKGNFGKNRAPYAEVREWDETNLEWVKQQFGAADSLADTEFSSDDPNDYVEVRVPKSNLGNPVVLKAQFYISGDVASAHSNFDAVPDDENLTNWGDSTTLDNYASPLVEVSGDAGWRLLSFPIAGAKISSISDDTPVQGITGGADAGSSSNVKIYDESGVFEDPASVSTVIDSGLGFALYFYDNTINESSELPVTLHANGSEPSSDVTVTLNPTASGYTLVGNPFQSNLNTNALTASGSGISNTIGLWNDGSGSYATPDRTTSYIVSPWQAFWVQTVSAASTTLTIPTSGKTSSDTSGTFFSKTANNRGDIHFTLSSETTFDEAIRLAFREDATYGYDADDFGKLTPLLASYATMAFASNDMLKSVESLPYDLDQEVTVELHPQLVGVSGEFAVAWNGLETIPAEWELTLHDYEMDVSVNMRDASEYVFTAGAQAKINPNPLSLLTGPAAVAMKAKTESNRFGITIRPTSVNNEVGDTPLVFGLEQNYPNPFNPSTTISYTLETAGNVNISVYTLMGQRVATLVNEAKTAGTYSVRWNATGAASGMYYYRLEANGQSITRKMTLIK